MILIRQPSFALNAEDVPGQPYTMMYTKVVTASASPNQLFDEVASIAKLNPLYSLIINCHGFYGKSQNGKRGGGFGLDLGTGLDITNVSLFSKLKGLVDRIYIIACGAARPSLSGPVDGNGAYLCQEIAKNSGAFVIAGLGRQFAEDSIPMFHIDDLEGWVVVLNKRGELVSVENHGIGFGEWLWYGYN